MLQHSYTPACYNSSSNLQPAATTAAQPTTCSYNSSTTYNTASTTACTHLQPAAPTAAQPTHQCSTTAAPTYNLHFQQQHNLQPAAQQQHNLQPAAQQQHNLQPAAQQQHNLQPAAHISCSTTWQGCGALVWATACHNLQPAATNSSVTYNLWCTTAAALKCCVLCIGVSLHLTVNSQWKSCYFTPTGDMQCLLHNPKGCALQ